MRKSPPDPARPKAKPNPPLTPPPTASRPQNQPPRPRLLPHHRGSKILPRLTQRLHRHLPSRRARRTRLTLRSRLRQVAATTSLDRRDRPNRKRHRPKRAILPEIPPRRRRRRPLSQRHCEKREYPQALPPLRRPTPSPLSPMPQGPPRFASPTPPLSTRTGGIPKRSQPAGNRRTQTTRSRRKSGSPKRTQSHLVPGTTPLALDPPWPPLLGDAEGQRRARGQGQPARRAGQAPHSLNY